MANDTINAVKIRKIVSTVLKMKYPKMNVANPISRNLRDPLLVSIRPHVFWTFSFSSSFSFCCNSIICFSDLSSSASCLLVSGLIDLRKFDHHLAILWRIDMMGLNRSKKEIGTCCVCPPTLCVRSSRCYCPVYRTATGILLTLMGH